MKLKHERKPRGMKLPRGDRPAEKSYDLCACCYAPHCDPFLRHPNVEQRLRQGLCPACGQPFDLCTCKSQKHNTAWQTHNNKHRKAYIQRRNMLINLAQNLHQKYQSDESYLLLRAITNLRIRNPKDVKGIYSRIACANIKKQDRTKLQAACNLHIEKSQWLLK